MLAKKKAKDLVLDALFFIAGSFLFAVSIDTFTAPNQIAAGRSDPVWQRCSTICSASRLVLPIC